MTPSENCCPSRDELHSLVAGTPNLQRQAELECHLCECEPCCELLSELTDSDWRILLPAALENGPYPTSSIGGRESADTDQAIQHRTSEALRNASPAPLTDSQLPDLRPFGIDLIERIGRGGMGTVYRARQLQLNRIVAVKLFTETADHPERWVRFRHEAQAAARLQHENLVRIHDTGAIHGCSWIVQEYCDGGTLLQRIHAAPLSGNEAARIVARLAGAVQHAHDEGIIHRDIKPANVLFSGDNPRLGDFGVARQIEADGVTQTGEVVGTPSYMSPEQASGASRIAGPASDIYGLGTLLYEALTGVPPFRAPTVVETLRMVVEQEPIPLRRLQPSVPRDLETICLKCLDKDPGRRYATAKDVGEDLIRFLEGRPIAARPGSAVRKIRRWMQRNRVAAGLLLGFLLSLVGFLAIWVNLTLQLNQTNVQLTQQTGELQQKTQEAIESEQEALSNLEAQTAANAALQEVLNFFTRDLFDAATTEQQGVNLTVLEVLDQADAKIRAKTPDRPKVEAPLRLAIGNTLDLVGQPQKAIVHLERADELYREYDSFSATAFDCRQVLARCLAGMGDRQRALKLTTELSAPEWKPTILQEIRLRHDLLRFEPSNRSTEETVQLLSELHADCVEKLGPREVVTLSILSAIATAWFRAGEIEKALEIFKTQLQDSERELGLDHVDTYNAANNVAVALIRLGRMDEAEAIHRENLRRQIMFRGPRDAGTSGTMHNLAMVLWRQNKRRDAVDLLKDVVQGRAAALGPVERRTLESLYQIGRMFVEMREFEEGYAFLTEQFWAFKEAARGTREWVDMFNVFASIAVSAGAYDDAESSIQIAGKLLDAMGEGYSSQHNALKAAEASLHRAKAE